MREREPQKEEQKQNKRSRESQPATKRSKETARKTSEADRNGHTEKWKEETEQTRNTQREVDKK